LFPLLKNEKLPEGRLFLKSTFFVQKDFAFFLVHTLQPCGLSSVSKGGLLENPFRMASEESPALTVEIGFIRCLLLTTY
jgi:hypothetical protein